MNSVDSPSTGNPSFRVYDPSSTNYLELYNDGTNSYIRSNTGDVVLGSGSGGVNIEDLIANESINNNGALVFADKSLFQATENAGNALAIFDQQGAGDILTASASGTTKLTLDTSGNLSFAGGQSFLTTLASADTTGARTLTIPSTSGGDDIFCLQGANNCAGTSFWSVSGGALSPANEYKAVADLLLGHQPHHLPNSQ